MEGAYSTWCGVDVGKRSHFAVVLGRDGEVHRGPVGQDEREMEELIGGLDRALVVVDQPGPASALLLSVCAKLGVDAGFVPPKVMARAIELYDEDLKTDEHDAFVIADLARAMPALVRPVDRIEGDRAAARALVARYSGLSAECQAMACRIRELLLEVCPAMEREFPGDALKTRLALFILSAYGGPCALRRAGRSRVERRVRSQPGMGDAAARRAGAIVDAVLDSQSVRVPGAEELEALIRDDASIYAATLERRDSARGALAAALEGVPEAALLMTMPGVGPVTAGTFVAEVGDVSGFRSAAALSSYCGLSPRVRKSGTTLDSKGRKRKYNRKMKRALIKSAFTALQCHPASREYYSTAMAKGRCHNQAIAALAHRRLCVMYAMLRDGRPYQEAMR
jgi:transposase